MLQSLLVVERRNGATAVAELEAPLEESDATVLPFGAAKARGARLLFVGEGFARTALA